MNHHNRYPPPPPAGSEGEVANNAPEQYYVLNSDVPVDIAAERLILGALSRDERNTRLLDLVDKFQESGDVALRDLLAEQYYPILLRYAQNRYISFGRSYPSVRFPDPDEAVQSAFVKILRPMKEAKNDEELREARKRFTPRYLMTAIKTQYIDTPRVTKNKTLLVGAGVQDEDALGLAPDIADGVIDRIISDTATSFLAKIFNDVMAGWRHSELVEDVLLKGVPMTDAARKHGMTYAEARGKIDGACSRVRQIIVSKGLWPLFEEIDR